MRIKAALIALLAGLVMMGTGIASPVSTVDLTQPVYRHCYTNPTGCLEIYTDTLGEIRYRELTDPRNEATVTLDDVATAVQIAIYNQYATNVRMGEAETRLEAEIEPGKTIIQWLRDYADEQQNAYDSWDAWTTAQRMAAMKEKMRKDAIFMDGFADLLITMGRGQ